MRLLLTSFGHESIGSFVTGRVAYVPDATRSFAHKTEWVNVEREMLRGHGLEIVELPLAATAPAETDRVLGEVDGVYVAGGETFDLLGVLRTTGNFEVLRRHVLAGLPYIGTSAGAVLAGPSIEPVSLMDDPGLAGPLSDYSGLGLTDYVIIPHLGDNPPFSMDVFAETVRTYGADWKLVLLHDGQALLVDDDGTHLV
ncbi:Type 1 glutamine amidotransferase-like domain-containing protein [Corynebacterium guangdongense]|uniref:Dipeptidase E n=1 Tax=Corynebacterium guangdongense TaxID=1783348 RepID=A0ABU1ZUJ3_9CORY|nr:Type 1 glutamine amidotransferase-like domain-containing protein [Corynebacterium guangdongense]MDR7328460.1 dipeptidase E [Corynebacterium guangdongense]WJZ17037.1 putative peptidase [Corynebacterium guangdongense]